MYHPSQTIFEKIEEEGIAVPPELKYSRYRATFDIEGYYPAHTTNLPEKRDKLEYTAEHQFLSISVASNVPGYKEPRCFVVEEEGREAARAGAGAGAAGAGGGDGGEYWFRRGQ